MTTNIRRRFVNLGSFLNPAYVVLNHWRWLAVACFRLLPVPLVIKIHNAHAGGFLDPVDLGVDYLKATGILLLLSGLSVAGSRLLKKQRGYLMLPILNATGEEFNGPAVSEELVAELQRIRRAYERLEQLNQDLEDLDDVQRDSDPGITNTVPRLGRSVKLQRPPPRSFTGEFQRSFGSCRAQTVMPHNKADEVGSRGPQSRGGSPMAKRFSRLTLFALLLAVNRHVAQGQSPPPAPSVTQDDQRLRDARTAKEEAETAYYREQVAKLREPPRPNKFWQNIEDNPASALGVLGAIIAALVGLYSLYKNQRLTIETQNDAQFYEALKRFGDKDSARLRSSAVGLLTDMATRNIINHPVRSFGRVDRVASKYFTVLNQLVAASRLEEHRVVLNAIKNAIEELATSDPVSVMKALHRANINLQEDLKGAIQTYSFHFMEPDLPEIAGDKPDARPKISPAMWRPLEQVTGFNSYLLYDWFGHVTHNFQEYDESSLAEVADMTAEEKVRHRQRAVEHIKIIAYQLRQNVEACCSTFFKLATELNESELYTAWRPFRAQAGKSRQSDEPALSLDGIFLARGKLADLRMPSSKGGRLRLHGAFLYEVDLSRARLIGAQMSTARLIGADLSGAVLTGSDLADTRLEEARFQGADLSNAYVHNAKLWHAKFDQESILVNMQWWTANFFDTLNSTAPNPTAKLIGSGELTVDEQLIAALLSRSRTDALVDAHESVKKYQQMREERVV